MNSFLCCLDEDYRNNLSKHHLNRIYNGYILHNSKLARSKFSFKNIHMNLGNIRLYSTQRFVNLNFDPVWSKNLFTIDNNYLKLIIV